MVLRKPPTSNTERQRQFRKRHPGYYGRLRRKRNAELEAMCERRNAIEKMLLAAPTYLMLPAPVETIDIPGMTSPAIIPNTVEAMIEVIASR